MVAQDGASDPPDDPFKRQGAVGQRVVCFQPIGSAAVKHCDRPQTCQPAVLPIVIQCSRFQLHPNPCVRV